MVIIVVQNIQMADIANILRKLANDVDSGSNSHVPDRPTPGGHNAVDGKKSCLSLFSDFVVRLYDNVFVHI